MGENMVKGTKGAKVKVLSKDYTWFVLVYNFILYILSTPFNINIYAIWFYIMYIKHSCPLSHKHEQLLLKTYVQNPQFSGSKTLLNQMCSNWL